jgi:enamine deaminase RidA (YjgF/YER057c/UK114 family)
MEKEQNVATSVQKYSTDDFDVVIISKAHLKKYYLNANFKKFDNPGDLFKSVDSFIKKEKAQIISQDFFGTCSLYNDCIDSLTKTFGSINWPVTWIEGNGSEKPKITGTQLLAISGVPVVTPIRLNDRIVGSYYKSDEGQICYLGGLLPDNVNNSNMVQTKEVFEKIETVLNMVGMEFSHVVRTWLYINNILDWYDDFNEVRTTFFNQRKVFESLVPASTGIGVSNPASAALVTEVLAIKPFSDNIKIEKTGSPLQCAATDYKSSFSRAVEVKFSDYRRLYVSGTASIDGDGKTIHVGDVKKQISQTMEVVEAILKSRDMGWGNVSRAIAYFPDLSNAYLLEEYCKRMSIPNMPIAIAHGDICRDDLLFEIEVDAVKTDA